MMVETNLLSKASAYKNDMRLIEITRAYIQLREIYCSLKYVCREDNDRFYQALDKLMVLAEGIEPKTLEGCAAKFVIAQIGEENLSDSNFIVDRLLASSSVIARQIIKNSGTKG